MFRLRRELELAPTENVAPRIDGASPKSELVKPPREPILSPGWKGRLFHLLAVSLIARVLWNEWAVFFHRYLVPW
jgi:hypothetical protein